MQSTRNSILPMMLVNEFVNRHDRQHELLIIFVIPSASAAVELNCLPQERWQNTLPFESACFEKFQKVGHLSDRDVFFNTLRHQGDVAGTDFFEVRSWQCDFSTFGQAQRDGG